MSLAVSTWIGAIATVVLAVGAGFRSGMPGRLFGEQSKELGVLRQQAKDQQEINRKQTAVLNLQVQEVSGGSAITGEQKLVACFMPGDNREFSSYVAAEHLPAFNDGRVNAVVQFRTVGDDWWRAGTDGGLASNVYMITADSDWAAVPWPPARARDQALEGGREDGQ